MGQRGPLIALALVLCAATAQAAPHDPRAIAIVLDRSAQMAGDRLPVAKQAVLDLVDGLDNTDRVAVVAFGARATVVAKLLGPNPRQLAGTIDLVGSDGPEANLAAGLDAALDLLRDAHVRDRRVILVTASEDTAGIAAVLDRHRSVHAALTTIAIGLDNPIAIGELYRHGTVRTIDDLVELPGALRDAAPPRPLQPETPQRAIAFVIDRSGSMHGTKLATAKDGVRALEESLPPGTIITVIAFDSEAMVLVRPQRGPSVRIANDIARLDHAGGTNIFTGLKLAYETLQDINIPVRDKQVVLITDGGTSATDGIPELLTEMRGSHITTTVIGFDGADRDTLRMIANEGDGPLYLIDDKGPVPELFGHRH